MHNGQLVSERVISRSNEARERTMNRSEWSSERRTDDTNGAYRRTRVTSSDTTITVFLVATPFPDVPRTHRTEAGRGRRGPYAQL